MRDTDCVTALRSTHRVLNLYTGGNHVRVECHVTMCETMGSARTQRFTATSAIASIAASPMLAGAIAQDVGRRVAGDALRNIPLFGRAIADNVVGQDPRYIYSLTPQQLEGAWKQVQQYFHECPTCKQFVCPSCFDPQSGYCTEDSPRRGEIAEAQAQQAAGVVKGLASALAWATQFRRQPGAKTAAASAARCPKDGTLAAPGTKFCPECGAPMIQPAANACPKCGATLRRAPSSVLNVAPRSSRLTHLPQVRRGRQGAKFCPNVAPSVALKLATWILDEHIARSFHRPARLR